MSGLENGDGVTAIDTLTNKVIATTAIGQAPQALTYVPDAVPSGDGTQNLVPLGLAGQATHLSMAALGDRHGQRADKRHVVQPGTGAGAGGGGDRPGAEAALRSGARRPSRMAADRSSRLRPS